MDKPHPLATYVQILPYELYNYRKFFESMGVKSQPESSKVEELLRNQQQQPIDELLFKWIKDTYTTDRRLLQLINDFETKAASKGNSKSKSIGDDQTRITFSSTLDLAEDKIYLYLPGRMTPASVSLMTLSFSRRHLQQQADQCERDRRSGLDDDLEREEDATVNRRRSLHS